MADTDTESDIFICRRTLRCQILKILSRIYGVIKYRLLVCKTCIDKTWSGTVSNIGKPGLVKNHTQIKLVRLATKWLDFGICPIHKQLRSLRVFLATLAISLWREEGSNPSVCHISLGNSVITNYIPLPPIGDNQSKDIFLQLTENDFIYFLLICFLNISSPPVLWRRTFCLYIIFCKENNIWH